jgi:sugar phosphate isomerase/epimerase
MQVLLNTIALEPNRWAREKPPYYRLVDLLGPIADAGFDALEVWQNHVAALPADQVPALADLGRKLGVQFPITGAYPVLDFEGREREAELKRMEELFRRAGMLGSRVVKIFGGRVASQDVTGLQWHRSIEFVREMLKASADSKLTLTAETHSKTLADEADAALRFIETVGSDRLKICWQPYGMRDTEKTIGDFDRLAKHVIHVHLIGRKGPDYASLEESDLDNRRALEHYFEAGFDGFLSIEFVKGSVVEPPEQIQVAQVLANAARDRDFVRSLKGYVEGPPVW